MKRAGWRILLAFVASCSSRDESLGKTRPPPEPIIDVEPEPNPPPQPNPDPNPDPNPNPSVPPCEQSPDHVKHGKCVALADCYTGVIDRPGYECVDGTVCCNVPLPGCSLECCSPDCAPSQGGQGSAGEFGVGGNP